MATFYLFCILTVFLLFSTAASEGFVCRWSRYGTLKNSYGVNLLNVLSTPCKYTMADLICGSYRIEVMAESSRDEAQFSPSNVRVKITDGDGKEWEASVDNTAPVQWQQIQDILSLETSTHASMAEVHLLGAFAVRFKYVEGGEKEVMVQCLTTEPALIHMEYLRSLCAISSLEEARSRQWYHFGSRSGSLAATLLYDALNIQNTEQSDKCHEIASTFEGVESVWKKREVARTCTPFFANPYLVSTSTSNGEMVSEFKKCMDEVISDPAQCDPSKENCGRELNSCMQKGCTN